MRKEEKGRILTVLLIANKLIRLNVCFLFLFNFTRHSFEKCRRKSRAKVEQKLDKLFKRFRHDGPTFFRTMKQWYGSRANV